jgi:hypothetical protein
MSVSMAGKRNRFYYRRDSSINSLNHAPLSLNPTRIEALEKVAAVLRFDSFTELKRHATMEFRHIRGKSVLPHKFRSSAWNLTVRAVFPSDSGKP